MKRALTDPLSEPELDRLQAILDRIPGSMNLETLDGFFAALIAGPELIMPSEYLPVAWGGGELPEESAASADAAELILQLMMRHWNAIASDLEDGGVHVPLVFERDDGRPEGEDWARGFMRGVDMRRPSWSGLIQDDEKGGAILPIAVMAGEVDPKWPKKPLSAKKQQDMIALMGAGLITIYGYYLEQRRREGARAASARTHRRASPKTGRNDPCPCGSGQKFKLCCGAAGGQPAD